MWRIFVPEFPKVEGEGSRCLSFSIPLLFCIPLLFNFPLLLRRVLLSSSGEHSSPHQNHIPPPCTRMHTHAHTRTHNAHILILLLKLEHTLGPRPVSHAVLHNGRLRLASRSWLRSGSLRDVAPFGTDYVAKSLAAMAARDFVKEPSPRLPQCLESAARQRQPPAARVEYLLGTHGWLLEAS